MTQDRDHEDDDMEETGPGAPTRREGDRRHRLFRFDPTVSTGILLNILGMLITLSVAYSNYREDRTAMLKDIEAVKSTAQRDRDDLKSAVADLKIDIRDMKSDLRELSRSVENGNNRIQPKPRS
jgi:hypothetical protein